MAQARQYWLQDLSACDSLDRTHGGNSRITPRSRSYAEQLSWTLDAASTPG